MSTSLPLESQKTVAHSCRNHIPATRLAGSRFKNQTGPERSPLHALQVLSMSDGDGLWLSFISISIYSTSHRSSSEKYPTKIEAQSRKVKKNFFLNILKNISNSVKKRKALRQSVIIWYLCNLSLALSTSLSHLWFSQSYVFITLYEQTLAKKAKCGYSHLNWFL